MSSMTLRLTPRTRSSSWSAADSPENAACHASRLLVERSDAAGRPPTEEEEERLLRFEGGIDASLVSLRSNSHTFACSHTVHGSGWFYAATV